ncbi:MAG: rhomboid family intramembrane serine protease [Rhizobiales bacterium]|nr:rhomboid family intramembrane serine protease [Hyphomicrobiales bacterium]
MDMRSNLTGGASQRLINSPPVVIGSIVLLLAVHLAIVFLGEDWQIWSIAVFGFNPLRWLPDTPIAMIQGSQYWSLVSYALLHADWIHVGLNCLWLLVFGTPVARLGGPWRFLAVCLAGAIGGSLASLILHWGQNVNLIGASGAVSGLLAGSVPILYGAASPKRYLSPGELLRSRSALIFMAIWLAITLITGSANMTAGAFDGLQIAWEAHIGGFVLGLIGFYVVMPRGRRVQY